MYWPLPSSLGNALHSQNHDTTVKNILLYQEFNGMIAIKSSVSGRAWYPFCIALPLLPLQLTKISSKLKFKKSSPEYLQRSLHQICRGSANSIYAKKYFNDANTFGLGLRYWQDQFQHIWLLLPLRVSNRGDPASVLASWAALEYCNSKSISVISKKRVSLSRTG